MRSIAGVILGMVVVSACAGAGDATTTSSAAPDPTGAVRYEVDLAVAYREQFRPSATDSYPFTMELSYRMVGSVGLDRSLAGAQGAWMDWVIRRYDPVAPFPGRGDLIETVIGHGPATLVRELPRLTVSEVEGELWLMHVLPAAIRRPPEAGAGAAFTPFLGSEGMAENAGCCPQFTRGQDYAEHFGDDYRLDDGGGWLIHRWQATDVPAPVDYHFDEFIEVGYAEIHVTGTVVSS